MDELGLDFAAATEWFPQSRETPYVLIELSAATTSSLPGAIATVVRRCYITDQAVIARAAELERPAAQIVASKLPDPGSTMAGDFGEILCYLYQSAKEQPAFAIGAKKWRLKQDRTKPAPRSDVVHFLMPNRPLPSANDVVLCAEVKVKSTNGDSTPIASAIEDCAKDRTSRLSKTLVWLRERAMTENLGDIDIALLDRFIQLVDHPPVSKRFRAVAVICQTIADNELLAAPVVESPEFTLIAIVVPGLKETYEAVYAGARQATP